MLYCRTLSNRRVSIGNQWLTGPHQICLRNHEKIERQHQLTALIRYFKLFRVTCDNKCHIWKKHKCNSITDSKLGDYPLETTLVLLCGERYVCQSIYVTNCLVSYLSSLDVNVVISRPVNSCN